MKKVAKKILNSLRFPYTCTHVRLVGNRSIRFRINNQVEKFRLQHFGGERAQLMALLNLLQEDDVLYDIGASVGAWSVPAAIKVSKGKVISFEPDPENRDRLVNNFALNQLTNYQIMPVAVGEQTGELELYTAGAYAASPSLRPVNNINKAIKVKVEKVDDLVNRKEIPPPTVVKIDIEGAEMMALRGMTELLSGNKRPRALTVELHPLFLPAFETDLTEIFKFMINKGYKIGAIESRDDQVICTWLTS